MSTGKSLLLVLGAALVAAAFGCQIVGDLQSRSADPIATGCSLPGASNGNGLIRLVNVANVDPPTTDFCIRTSGASSWGRPVLRDGGDDGLCRGGLPYASSTFKFNVPAGSIDVKAIPTGQTCDAPATSEIDGMSVGDAVSGGASAVTVVRYGGGSSPGTPPEKIVALPEEPQKLTTTKSLLRFVNALSGTEKITVGFAGPKVASLPTTVVQPYLPQSIAPGGVEPPGSAGPNLGIDAEGYAELLPQTFTLVAAKDGDTAGIALFQTPAIADQATLYVIGDPSDNTYAVRGLYCEDLAPLSSAAGDQGAGSVPSVDGGLTAQDLGVLTNCVPTKLPILSVDTFNASLYGDNSSFYEDRKGQMPNFIANRSSDLMCLLEVDDSSARNAIVNALNKASPNPYPNVYQVTTSITTPPSDAMDVRSPPGAPCGGVDVSQSIGCVNQNCSTAPNDPSMGGFLDESTTCISNNCVPELLPIRNNAACFDCLLYYFTSLQPISSAGTECTQDPHAPFAFVGQTPSMILSRFDFVPDSTNNPTKAYILPATGFRRAVLKAQVEIDAQTHQRIDFFCAQLSSPLLDTDLPYAGFYGSKWEDEQDLQIQRAVKWIQQEADADGVPAIIAGDWHATLEMATVADGGTTLGTLSPEVVQALDSRYAGPFTRASPQGYTPTCDYCPAPTNPYLPPNSTPYEFTPTYYYDPKTSSTIFGKNAAQSDTLWPSGMASTFPLTGSTYEPPPPSKMGPPSEVFPRNVTIVRPGPRPQ